MSIIPVLTGCELKSLWVARAVIVLSRAHANITARCHYDIVVQDPVDWQRNLRVQGIPLVESLLLHADYMASLLSCLLTCLL